MVIQGSPVKFARARLRLQIPGLVGLLAFGRTRPNPAFWPESRTMSSPAASIMGAGGAAALRPPPADAATPPEAAPADAALDVGPASRPSGFDLETGLLGFWTFEEDGGAAVLDRSGRSNHGTLENLDAQRARVGGHRGRALEFLDSAVNPGVLVPLSAPVRDLTTFTIAAWAYRTKMVDGVQNAVLSRQLGTGPRQVWDLAFDGDALAAIQSQETASTPLLADASVTAPLNQWLHVAATYDGAALRVYQNGQLVGTTLGAWTFPRSENPVYIGTNKNMNKDEPMIGLLDDVLLYGVALPPGAIKALFDGYLPPER
jgi:hypothetical protein